MGVIEIDGAIENGTKVGGFMEDGHMIYTTIEVLKKPKTDTVGTLVADANSLLANATGGRRRVRGWIDMGPSYRWPR